MFNPNLQVMQAATREKLMKLNLQTEIRLAAIRD